MQHKAGEVHSTRRYCPWRLVYYEAFETEKDARMREQKYERHGKGNHELKKRLKYSLIGTEEKKKKGEGFTFIEVMIYLALIGLVVTGFVSFNLSVSESRNKTFVAQEVQANVRTAMDIISQRIRAATGVNTGTSTFDSDPGVLSLVMVDSAKNPTLISLSQDNGTLQITEGVSSAVAITSTEVQVTNLVFTDLTSTSSRENIRLVLTIAYNAGGSDLEFTHSQTATTSVSIRQ
jgi:Tfp pilus assembly protein PilW